MGMTPIKKGGWHWGNGATIFGKLLFMGLPLLFCFVAFSKIYAFTQLFLFYFTRCVFVGHTRED